MASPTPLRILGIDPGSRTLGFAVVEFTGSTKRSVLTIDVLRLASIEDHVERLQEIFTHLCQIIDIYHPTECGVETPVYGKDPLAMLKLGRAQAACMLAASSNGLVVKEYYPKSVKKSITGNGNASKNQVAFMLHRLMNVDERELARDATDALAVAWCHYQQRLGLVQAVPKKKTHQNRAATSWESFVKQNPNRLK